MEAWTPRIRQDASNQGNLEPYARVPIHANGSYPRQRSSGGLAGATPPQAVSAADGTVHRPRFKLATYSARGERKFGYTEDNTEPRLSPGLHFLPLRAAFAPTGAFTVRCFFVSRPAQYHIIGGAMPNFSVKHDKKHSDCRIRTVKSTIRYKRKETYDTY